MIKHSDSKLINRFLKGDIKSFEILVDRYQKTVYNASLRVVSNEEDAKDITQSVFIKVYEKINTYNQEYKFFSWVYRMTINESINFLKMRRNNIELSPGIVSNEKDPEQQYSELELSEKVQKALMKLTIDNRVVVVLRHFVDLTYREISYILEIPEKTIKSRLYSARRLLGNILTDQGIVTND